jgi:hypothetical protein
VIHYDGRRFRPWRNSVNGQVNRETLFEYRQSGNLLTATYAGGGILNGSIIGLVAPDGSLHFCYQHLTDAGELRSGECHSTPERLPNGRLRLHERWRWTLGSPESGESVVEEVD